MKIKREYIINDKKIIAYSCIEALSVAYPEYSFSLYRSKRKSNKTVFITELSEGKEVRTVAYKKERKKRSVSEILKQSKNQQKILV